MRGVREASVAMSLVALMALAGCGGGGSSDGGSEAGAGTDTTAQAVTTAAGNAATTLPAADPDAGAQVMNYTFTVSGAVSAGTPLTVTNKDKVTHTFTNPDGAFSVEVPAGESAEVTIAAPGTYKVVCTIHSSMGAQLVVV